MDKAQLEEAIIRALKTVYDPEIPVNLYEMGMRQGGATAPPPPARGDRGALLRGRAAPLGHAGIVRPPGAPVPV
jgi:hypothetical protein